MKLCKKSGVMLTKSQKKTFDSGGNWGEGEGDKNTIPLTDHTPTIIILELRK